MIARGFKPVVWVGAVGAAAIGCYMLSLRVASERADLAGLERRIVETRQQIRSLQTELGTRGRLGQLEQYNDQVLALAAPNSGQYVHAAELARFETHEDSPLDQNGDVRMAAAETGPDGTVAAPPRQAVARRPAIAPATPLQQPATVQRASLDVPAVPAASVTPRAAHGVATVHHDARPAIAPVSHDRPTVADAHGIAKPSRGAAAAPVRTAAGTSAPGRTAAGPLRAAGATIRTHAATPVRIATAAPIRPHPGTISAVPRAAAAAASRRPAVADRSLRELAATPRGPRSNRD